ncbi:MAG TPA: hypothetical protein VD768_04890 [Sphingomicrobium sp.]|nr:hypothetical protein [Sphingomicrobium sp.]
MIKSLLFIAAAALAAQAQPVPVPRGAVVGSSGHATILNVPPAPFVPAEPTPPPALSPDQIKGHDDFRRAGEFQNRVREEVEALTARLRRAEKGNFVDLYYENEGEPHVVFRFLRAPEATLAKYAAKPYFRAAPARYSNAELRRAMDFMFQTFRDDRIIMSGGVGNKANRAEIEIAITEEEFRELVARKGVRIPEAVVLNFRAKEPASALNRPLAPNIAPLVRIFARDDRPVGIVHSIDSHAKVVLRDGCFRSPDQGDAHVLFPLGAQLFIDREGYLAYGPAEGPGYARVAEELVFPGSIGEVTAPEIVKSVHAACGPGKVIKLTGMRSAAADRVAAQVSTNATNLRLLKESYGLSDDQARKVFFGAKVRQDPEPACCLPRRRPQTPRNVPLGPN